MTEASVKKTLVSYRRSAQRLRSIHSLKLTRAKRAGQRLSISLVLLSTVGTFMGFVGTDELADVIGINRDAFTIIFNLILLGLLVAVILDLSYRWKDRAYEHQRALVLLTAFIRELEDVLALPLSEGRVAVERFRARYELIIEMLPPHTDADYLASKKADVRKQEALAGLAERSSKGLSGGKLRRVYAVWKGEL